MGRADDPVAARRLALQVVQRLRSAPGVPGGFVAYFAGGCVRDELLGLHPTDFDVATSATPQQVAALFPRSRLVGEAFGVVLVPMSEGGPGGAKGKGAASAQIEVATFRSDGVYSDRRRPDSITFSTPEQDAQRRDFTINALFLDPLAPPEPGSPVNGRLIDYVGGATDLAARVLRAVGDPHARLAEDHLRALRAVRFAARLGFAIDPATASAITQHASGLTGVSRERIGEEVRRMLSPAAPGWAPGARAAAVHWLTRLQLADVVLTDAPAASPECSRLAALPPSAGFPTALVAWLLDRHLGPAVASAEASLEPPRARRLITTVRDALCLSNDETDGLTAIVQVHHALLHAWPAASVAAAKRLAVRPGFAQALAVVATSAPDRAQAIASRVEELKVLGPGLAPDPLITGDDLIRAGFRPGPLFKRILDQVYDHQLEARISTPEQALSFARELAGPSGV